MTDPSQPLFLFGPGYCARALAALWPGSVAGSYRSDESRVKLSDTAIKPVSIADDDALSQAIAGAHVVISVPPTEHGCPAHARAAAYARQAASITYLSTTGVYGDLGGGWAMEWSPMNPISARARRRVAAETLWRETVQQVSLVRLPGIYGPGRSALDRLRSGRSRRIIKAGHVFSRAHVDDIASGLFAIITQGARGVFNLCDDLAAPPQDVIAYAADLLNMMPPPETRFEEADLSDMARSFYSECKRVSNARLKAVTGWRPQYPTYRQGLTAILAAGG
jgi:nucleoside-diphosphate-sugar epimerase